ncbi:MAG TPA: sigma-70 family RNA polymerase sigma factor [Isosphaeraceae bacterium]
MAEDDSFIDLIARLQRGDEDAAAAVFRRYLHRLIALASKQFDGRLRHKADPEDVVQSAFKSFFVRLGDGQFDLADWESLWGLLAVITLRKCYRRRDYLLAERRDVGRELTRPMAEDGSGSRWEFVDHEPTPLEAAILAETVQGLLDRLERPERQIVDLSLQGYTTPEIVAQLNRSQRTVQRVRERAKSYLNRLLAEEIDVGGMGDAQGIG